MTMLIPYSYFSVFTNFALIGSWILEIGHFSEFPFHYSTILNSKFFKGLHPKEVQRPSNSRNVPTLKQSKGCFLSELETARAGLSLKESKNDVDQEEREEHNRYADERVNDGLLPCGRFFCIAGRCHVLQTADDEKYYC